MRRTLALAFLAALASACGGSSGGSSSGGPASPRLASPVPAGTLLAETSFAQTVPAQDSRGEVFPGQANTWVLDRDFSLGQGYGLEFTTALALFLGTPTAPATHASLTTDVAAAGPGRALAFFPGDQAAAEATLLTPIFSAADGVRTVAVSDGLGIGLPALSGQQSAYLNGTPDSRLSRLVTLSAAASYTLSWKDRGFLRAGNLLGEAAAPYGPSYRVVLRDPASGASLAELFSAAADFGADAPLSHVEALPGGLSGPVRISFELRSAAGGIVAVDDVVLSDGSGPIAGAGGDFDAGLGSWTANDGAEVRNLRGGARTVALAGGGSLSVTRTFYAPPSATFGRLVDVFENAGAAPVTTSAVYLTMLDGASPLAAAAAGGRAVAGWDGAQTVRDVAIVHGKGTAYLADGSGAVFLVHPLVVPARGKVALAHFVVQLGTSEGGATSAAPPAGVAAEAAAIASGFPAGDASAADLEAGVRELVSNF